MFREAIERVISIDLINRAQMAVDSAAKGDRKNLESFLDALSPDDLDLLESPLETKFDADSLGINSNAWLIAKDLSPLAILRKIAEENKFKKSKTSE